MTNLHTFTFGREAIYLCYNWYQGNRLACVTYITFQWQDCWLRQDSKILSSQLGLHLLLRLSDMKCTVMIWRSWVRTPGRVELGVCSTSVPSRTWTKHIFLHWCFRFKYDFDRSTTHPKSDLSGVRTHDLHIMDSTRHVHEMLVLTTESSDAQIAQIAEPMLFKQAGQLGQSVQQKRSIA